MQTPRPDALASLPLPLIPNLRKLGADLCDARRRRRIPMALMAERANISRTTLHRIEREIPVWHSETTPECCSYWVSKGASGSRGPWPGCRGASA